MSKPARVSLASLALRTATLAVLAAASVISLTYGIRGALTQSVNLPWAAASLLRAGIDPWQAALAGSTAAPPHLHALYIIFRPLTHLSFPHAALAWCCLNLAFSIGSVALLKRLFRLSRFASLSLLFLLWISAPFRSTLQAGGVDILELFLLSVVFNAGNSTLRGVALGFSFCSYLYAPLAVSFFWFRGHLRTLVIAATVPILALVMTSGLLNKPVGELMSGPFAGSSVPNGSTDLLSGLLAAMSAYSPAFRLPSVVSILAGCVISGAFALFISRRQMSRGAQFALVATGSLFAISQTPHALMLLVAPLGYALSRQGRKVRAITLSSVALLWFSDIPIDYAVGSGAIVRSTFTIAASCLVGVLIAHLAWALPRIEARLVKRTEPADLAGSGATVNLFVA